MLLFRCRFCGVKVPLDPDKKPYDHFQEHVTSKWYLKPKAKAEKANNERGKQPTVTDAKVRQTESNKQGEDTIYDFVHALSYARISLEDVNGALGKFVKAYCPHARIMPSAKWLRDNHSTTTNTINPFCEDQNYSG